MTESSNSQLDFVHEPNRLISFINYQCLIYGEPIVIPKMEQQFIDDICSTDMPVVKRFHGRRTGGSTLLALIMFHSLLEGKKVLFVTDNDTMVSHFIKSVLEPIDIIGFNICANTSRSIYLELAEDSSRRTEPIIFRAGPTAGRGYSADLIVCDGFVTRRKHELDQLVEDFLPCICNSKNNGKLIINVTM